MAAPRTRLPREKRIAEIILAAREVFIERGYADTAIAEIASRIGVVEGAIYRFFESKRDLLIQVTCHWYEEVMAEYDSGLAECSGLRQRLRFVIWHHLVCIHRCPELVNLFFGLVRLDPHYLDSNLFRLNRMYMSRVTEILHEGIDRGEIRPDAPIRIARDLIYGCAEHRTWAFRMGLSDFDPEAVADEITDMILAACAPRRDPEERSGPAGRRLVEIAEELTSMAGSLGGERR